jgi:hypothetical protein
VKLIQEYWLVDRHGVRALVISADFSDFSVLFLRQMHYAYSIVYENRAPLRIVAIDVLGEQHEVQLEQA